MKKHSCGAILYTIHNNYIYIILGKEKNDWFPFKGTSENNETIKQTAIREIAEETCDCIKLSEDDISLDCNFQTNRKFYHIGLIYVKYEFMKKFYQNRKKISKKEYLEKSKISMFKLSKILDLIDIFHYITAVPILFYYPLLLNKQKKIDSLNKKIYLRSNLQKKKVINV